MKNNRFFFVKQKLIATFVAIINIYNTINKEIAYRLDIYLIQNN